MSTTASPIQSICPILPHGDRSLPGEQRFKDGRHLASEPPQPESFGSALHLLVDAVSAVDARLDCVAQHAHETERQMQITEHRSLQAEREVERLRTQLQSCEGREQLLTLEVTRLRALLEAQKLQAAFSEERWQRQLEERELQLRRMRLLRNESLLQQDELMSELATAYADMDAMHETMSDSAVYVRYLRKRLLELELQQHDAAASRAKSSAPAPGQVDHEVFSLSSVKAAVADAVRDACQHGEQERKRRLRQLQLRWHPDKNPMMKDLANEVTKLLLEAIQTAEADGDATHAADQDA